MSPWVLQGVYYSGKGNILWNVRVCGGIKEALKQLPECHMTAGIQLARRAMGKGHLSFNRAQTQYLDGVALRFIMASNGGFTVVAVVRFSGSPGHWGKDH